MGPGRHAACRGPGRDRAFADIERCEGQSDHAEGPGTHSPPRYRRVRRQYCRHSGRQRTLARFGTRRSHRDLSARPVTAIAVELEPLPYLTFLGLMARAQAVLTDSGGIQEETTALHVPCL